MIVELCARNINISDGLINGADGILQGANLECQNPHVWISFHDTNIGSKHRAQFEKLYKPNIPKTSDSNIPNSKREPNWQKFIT